MSIKLIVYNLPNINIDEFKLPFMDFKGFKNAQIYYNEKSEMLVNYIFYNKYLKLFASRFVCLSSYLN